MNEQQRFRVKLPPVFCLLSLLFLIIITPAMYIILDHEFVMINYAIEKQALLLFLLTYYLAPSLFAAFVIALYTSVFDKVIVYDTGIRGINLFKNQYLDWGDITDCKRYSVGCLDLIRAHSESKSITTWLPLNTYDRDILLSSIKDIYQE